MLNVINTQISFKLNQSEMVSVYGKKVMIKGITTCFIKEGDKTLTFGVTVRSPGDRNSAFEGRKHALVDALNNGNFSFDYRKEAWKAFIEKYPVPKKKKTIDITFRVPLLFN